MDLTSILLAVETAEAASESTTISGTVVPIEQIWSHITSLSVMEALTFASFGAVCLFYGWRVFKALVIISFTLLGVGGGVLLSEKISGENNPLLGILLGIVMAIVSVPLMRWAVCILGAVAGGVLTGGLWYAFSLPEQYIWAGALVGVIAGGMISFIVFRVAVMLFSSLGGSTLLMVGGLALLHLYPQTTELVEELFFGSKWFLPLTLLIPTAIGLYWQNKFIKSSADWSV